MGNRVHGRRRLTTDPTNFNDYSGNGVFGRDNRQAFSPALGKDDPSDADYLLDLLQHHRARLRPWRPDDEQTRTLRLLVEQRRRLINDRTRLSNRLTAQLKCYFPQVLDWFAELSTVLVCDFLTRWPTLTPPRKPDRPRS